MRVGTVGFALGIAGFKPTIDCRGSPDLYGRKVLITRINVADDLAAAAHLVIGETSERTPLAIIRGAPVAITDDFNPNEIIIVREDCMYMGVFLKGKSKRNKS
jgi:coenzyme F420-0:L-glutamate ligase/coenzyme F420-1:gamma-L-glutamate ligase